MNISESINFLITCKLQLYVCVSQELALAKVEAKKSLKAELEEVLAQNRILEEQLSSRDSECKVHEDRISKAMKRYATVLEC